MREDEELRTGRRTIAVFFHVPDHVLDVLRVDDRATACQVVRMRTVEGLAEIRRRDHSVV